MELSDLTNRLGRNKFGRILTAAGFLTFFGGCDIIFREIDRIMDKRPPCVNRLEVVGSDGGEREPSLRIIVSDSVCEKPAGRKKEFKVTDEGPKTEKKEELEMEGETDSFCSGLDKVLLYENDKLMFEFPEKEGSSFYKFISINHKEGKFKYKVVAYDKAGNKGESELLSLVFKGNYCFKEGVLEKDKDKPVYIELKKYPEIKKLCAEVEDKGVGIFEINFYEGEKLIKTEKAGDDPGYLGKYVRGSSYSCAEGVSKRKRYVVEATDFAGNKARAEVSF